MADVEYSVETRFEGENELRRAEDSFERLGDSGRRALDDIETKARGGLGLLNLEAGINLVGQALGTLQNVAGMALGALTEGAALSDARGDFADLTAEVNTTADAMSTRLRAATGGLVTDAQLIADASNLMALNLGLTEDEVVAFSGVAAELDLNMEALADTLNTGATRGLKEMGLSIADVKGRMAELEDQGIATDKAFRMAILEAAEEKIGRVGKKSEEAAGQIQKIEVAITNAGDAFKTAFAEGVTAGLSGAVGEAEDLERAITDVGTSAGNLAGQLGGTAAFQFASDAAMKRIKDLGGDLGEINRQIGEMERAQGANLFELGFDPRDAEIAAARYAILADELERLEGIQRMINAPIDYPGPPQRAIEGWRDLAGAVGDFNQASNQGAYTVPVAPTLDQAYYSYLAAGARDFNQSLIDQQVAARGAATAWEEYTSAITSRGGDLFADFIEQAGRASEAGEQWAFDLNRAIFDAANQEGAGADFLGGFAENIGAAAEDIAAAMQAAQQQALVTDLAAGVREAGIEWSEFPGIVEQAIAELEGTTARAPVVMPAPEDLGFREGWQEDFLPNAKEPIVVPMEIQIQEELIQNAVDNARGIVEGFTSPADAYQAVMDMDISAIETGVATATQLIQGVPTSKTVTINWKQTGADVVEALRALGVIP